MRDVGVLCAFADFGSVGLGNSFEGAAGFVADAIGVVVAPEGFGGGIAGLLEGFELGGDAVEHGDAALVFPGIGGKELTGFGSEESLYLSIMQTQVDVRGLLLAGIIIGALGVLDDVTVTQATTVAELSPTATSRLGLYQSAIRVGRAHIASAVNTIVLAYAGASLPLLILLVAGGRDVSDLLTSEFLAEEIVRSAVGTIGLVAAVPITTALAALVANVGSTAPESPGAHGHHRRRWTPMPTTRNTDPWVPD